MLVLFVLLVVCSGSALGWSNTPTFWPHYPIRSSLGNLQVLDGQWEYAYNIIKGDITATNINTHQYSFSQKVNVPSSFDYVAPGYEGPRGTAVYRTQVNITAGRRALVNFAACSFYCNVYVDNIWIGDHRAGGYTPFWLSIPPSTNKTRTIFAIVDNRFNSTTAPVHTGGDFYHFGGIFRSVIVHTLPETSRGNGVFLERLELSVRDVTGVVVKGTSVNGVVSLKSLRVPNPKPWNIGTPNLHTVLVSLIDSNNPYDDIQARFGIRVVSQSGSRVTINGQKVKLVGHNRHTMYPDVGPAMTVDQIMVDVQLLQDLGSNYVRGAHYPQDQRFLDICDEVGIVVWEEALGPSVTTANTQSAYFMKYQVIQMNEMISASFNHPSVIFWGFFNEGPSDNAASCPGYKTCVDVAHSRDTTRYATWANNHGLSDKCLQYADVISFNAYPGWYDHGGDGNYPIQYWNNLIGQAANGYKQPFTVSECEYIWVMADFKGNDGAQSMCGPCTYTPGTHDAIDINIGCNGSCGLSCRPCGENHKGTVDFWRRKKQSYDIVKKFYHQQWP